MLALVLGISLSLSGPLVLDAPEHKTVVRGDPVELPLRLASGQEHAVGVRVEVDGQLEGYLLPWTETLTLEPGLHKVRVRAYDRRDGTPLSSPAAAVAVFDEAKGPRLPVRERNGWIALVAFIVAVVSATALRKRGEL